MRDLRALLLTVPLMLGGSLTGHELGYRFTVPESHAREHALAASGHGYFAYLPVVLGVAGAFALLGFLILALRGASGRATGVPPAFVALLPSLTFVVQEHVERFLRHDGQIPWSASLEPTFVAGFVLQVPFAIAAFAVARALARLAVRLGRVLRVGPPPRMRLARPAFLVPEQLSIPPLSPLARSASERGPPFRL